MKEIYILFINLIISALAVIIRSYNSSESKKTSDESDTDEITDNKNRNTLYKLLSLKKRLEMQKHNKNID